MQLIRDRTHNGLTLFMFKLLGHKIENVKYYSNMRSYY